MKINDIHERFMERFNWDIPLVDLRRRSNNGLFESLRDENGDRVYDNNLFRKAMDNLALEQIGVKRKYIVKGDHIQIRKQLKGIRRMLEQAEDANEINSKHRTD